MAEPTSELGVLDVPTTLVVGGLGVGKTTAILDLLARRPPGPPWAVLVNEFGEIGVDGAMYEAGGVQVREVAGGCVCCSAGPGMRIALTDLLRRVRPARLFIEPSGLAHPAVIVDVLRRRPFRRALSLRATIALVDVTRGLSVEFDRGAAHARLQVADVLVGNRCDQATDEQVSAFGAQAAELYPPKLVVSTTEHAVLDPAWLELPACSLSLVPPEVAEDHGAVSRGFVFDPDQRFDRSALLALLQAMVRPGPLCPSGVMRIKGVFRTPGGWLLVQGTSDELRFEPTDHRRDSRLDVITDADPAPDWDAILVRLKETRCS
jgi:G3E family GTPase